MIQMIILSCLIIVFLGYYLKIQKANCSDCQCTSSDGFRSPLSTPPGKSLLFNPSSPSNVILKMKINHLIKQKAFERRRRKARSKTIRRLLKNEKKKNKNKCLAFFIQANVFQFFNCLGNYTTKLIKIMYKTIFSFWFKTRKCVSVLSLMKFRIYI